LRRNFGYFEKPDLQEYAARQLKEILVPESKLKKIVSMESG